MTRSSVLLLLGAILALPPSLACAETASGQAVAYPNNPTGTPATATPGTAPAAAGDQTCPAGGKCPGSPGPSTAADTSAPAGQAQTGTVATPTAAYPDSPVKTPAAESSSGTAPD